MPAGSFRQADVLCPYYRYDLKCCIHCEGIVNDSGIRLSFGKRDDFTRYMEHFCSANYDACLVYRAIDSTYEGVFDENE